MNKTYWVLSLDGGGVRGLYSSVILENIQKEFKIDISKHFDLIVGSSIGGLIGMYIAQGSNNPSVLFNNRNLTTIFNKSFWDKITPFQFKPKYDGIGKKKIIKENIIIKKLGDVKTKLALISYNITQQKHKIFKSWQDKDVCSILACEATSAAPLYFPSVSIDDCHYIDGGIVANNPSLIAYQEAQILFGKDADIRILSIGSGDGTNKIDGKKSEKYGGPQWICNGILEIIMDAPLDLMSDYCRQILPENAYLRLDAKINNEKLDDTSDEYSKYLFKKAIETFNANKKCIKKFFINNIQNMNNKELPETILEGPLILRRQDAISRICTNILLSPNICLKKTDNSCKLCNNCHCKEKNDKSVERIICQYPSCLRLYNKKNNIIQE